MKKSIFTAFAVGLCMAAGMWAQVPSYVPTNGLVGWWPFNGNANDESGNGNNGTVNGATLTTDRNGVANKAYSFDGMDDFISTSNDLNSYANGITINAWVNVTNANSSNNAQFFVSKAWDQTNGHYKIGWDNNTIFGDVNDLTQGSVSIPQTIPFNNYKNICFVYDNNSLKLFLNGVLLNSQTYTSSIPTSNNPILFGKHNGFDVLTYYYFSGNLDDIGIWNRSLNECEIQDLYNSQLNSVSGSISVSPQPATIGSSVLLSTASQTQNVQWQTAPAALNWQNVPNNANYSGGTTNSLTVSNVQLSNHNQPFRVIASAGNCTDTSNVASILIADTCITNVTVYETLLTTVTDTLIINTTLSLPAPNNENTILIYPNPASDHITIDNGNYTAMAGYTIKIENNAGQQVFQSLINQAQFYVDLSTWTGNGLYFVHLIDPQNNTVTVRKIVLQ